MRFLVEDNFVCAYPEADSVYADSRLRLFPLGAECVYLQQGGSPGC
ncbi:MAG: hypothetical protein ACRDZ2_10060 [Ilumatobacteraceae bacterium]